MTHIVNHQYDEILQASLPELEIHVEYFCESEIEFGEEGEEVSNRLIRLTATVNGESFSNSAGFSFSADEGKYSQQTREFLARLRESARQALYAEALRQTDAFSKQDKSLAAERWMRTGSTKLPLNISKPEPFYG